MPHETAAVSARVLSTPHYGDFTTWGHLGHQSTQFRLSASELLLFVSMVVLVLTNVLSRISNHDDMVSSQLICYDKKAISK